MAPRFLVELGEALRVRAQRAIVRGGARAQPGEKAIDAEVREAGDARVLSVAHARGVDLVIQRLIPRRALAHFRGAGSRGAGQVSPVPRGASRGEQRGADHEDGVAVGPGEALARRFAPRQPAESGVLLRRQRHRRRPGELQAEEMLGVVRHAGGEAVAPLRIDLEGIGHVPAPQAAVGRLDAGLLAQFARRRVFERLVEPVERPGDRLPEARPLCALEQQHLHLGGMHDHQHRERKLQDCLKSAGSGSACPGSTKMAKNGLPRAGPGFGAGAQYVDQHAEVVARLRALRSTARAPARRARKDR